MRRGVLKAFYSKEVKIVTTFSFNYILTLSNKKSKKAIFGFWLVTGSLNALKNVD